MTGVEDLLRQDAAEIASILRSTQCVARHSTISHCRLEEMLTALVTGGEASSGNAKVHDVIS